MPMIKDEGTAYVQDEAPVESPSPSPLPLVVPRVEQEEGSKQETVTGTPTQQIWGPPIAAQIPV
ncbi:MAG TPA: hypothetical protein VFK47_14425, partial [Ktedonobacteraceae bacterium]|nr:hypothetical protein [Ktedonobacteraceae bacterium]